MISPLHLVAALLAVLLSTAGAATPAGTRVAPGAQDAFLCTVQPGGGHGTWSEPRVFDLRAPLESTP